MAFGGLIAEARDVLGNAWKSWRSRNRLASIPGALGHPPRGTVKIAVYFSDTNLNLYQLRQWYGPLADLAESWPLAVISRSPGAMLRLFEECPVPVVYLRSVVDLGQFVQEQELALVLYVNQASRNFQMFRYGRMWHVFINHGESDKAYMSSNQHKAYDYCLVAGQAARDRLRHAVWDYDVEARTLMIGRPQADYLCGVPPYPRDGRTVVIYAPTWEGDRSSMNYSSLLSHGVSLAEALLADPDFRLVYRPHPRTGLVDSAYRAESNRIITAIRRANLADATAHHVYDNDPAIGWQLVAPDVAITDVSAIVYDRLATGKPILVTRPASPDAELDESGYLGACEWLNADSARSVASRIRGVLSDPESRERLQFWVERYFGDTTPGAATERLRSAVSSLIAEWERHARLHEGDPGAEDPGRFAEDAEHDDGGPAIQARRRAE